MTGREPLDIDRTQLGYAYVIYCKRSGLYKLGSARNPVARLKTLSREMQDEAAPHRISSSVSLECWAIFPMASFTTMPTMCRLRLP